MILRLFLAYLRDNLKEKELEQAKEAILWFRKEHKRPTKDKLIESFTKELLDACAAAFDNQAIKTGPALKAELELLLSKETEHAVNKEIQDFLHSAFGSAPILIQSAISIDGDLRSSMRSTFSKKYPYSFVSFQVNTNLLGGLRVFEGGNMHDKSWRGDIERLINTL